MNNGEKLVALTGQGGIGKSVLAAVAARRMAWRYPGGVFWRSAENVELGLNELLDSFANIFGHEFRTLELDTKQDAVLGYLGDYQTQSLIVVDNAEDIKDKALWRFLEGLPKPSAALVTTRLARPREGTQIAIHQMENMEAVRLFVLEARRRSSRFGEKHTKQDERALDQIIRLLDGHPLGIKLAAGLVSSTSLEGILEKIVEAPPKEVSDRFDFSYNTLTQSQKTLLQRTAAFGGTFAEWAIQAVSEGPLFEDDRAEPLSQWKEDLSELVKKSFVDLLVLPGWDESGNEIAVMRYRLHPLMRQYARQKAGDRAMKIHRGRAAHLFLGYAEQFGRDFSALEAEHDNILSGADFAIIAESWEMVERFAWTLDPYLRTRGYWKNLRTILENFIKAAEMLGDKSGVSGSLHNLGALAQDTGDYKEARRLYQESLKIEQDLGDKSGVAFSLAQSALLEEKTGNIKKALDLIKQAEGLFLELKSPMATQARKDRERLEKKR
jgi:predicted ATPase